jgi:hypothetical protein
VKANPFSKSQPSSNLWRNEWGNDDTAVRLEKNLACAATATVATIANADQLTHDHKYSVPLAACGMLARDKIHLPHKEWL